MSDRGPWNMRGIDQRARAAAREAAREEGLSVAEYLSRLLSEEAEPPRPDPRGSGKEYSADATATAVTLDHLTKRIEAAEARSTLAITGIDQSVVGLLARLERTEDNQSAVSGHIGGLIDDLRQTHEALREKVARIEADDSNVRNLDALKSLEDALGKLASHVFEENGRQQDEAEAVKVRVESGFTDLGDRVEGMEAKVHSTLAEAAERVEKAVSAAELRAEGTAHHLSERFSTLEARVGEKLATVGQVSQRMDSVEADVTGALGSMEQTLLRIQDRLNRAETTTDAALQSLEASFTTLDERIEAVASQVDPEAAGQLREQFESRFEGLAEELRASLASAREEMARKIEDAATQANPEVFAGLQQALDEVHARLNRNESRQSRSLEAVGDQVSRIGEGLDRRLSQVEQRNDMAAAEAVREEIDRLSHEFGGRIDEIEQRERDAFERVGAEMSQIADRLEARVGESENRAANAIEQVGEQVAGVARRLENRQQDALGQFAERIDKAEKRNDARLTDVLTSVTERFERIQQDTSSSASPVQKAISSLAARLDIIERGHAPSAAQEQSAGDLPDLEPVGVEFGRDADDDADFEPGLPDWDSASDDDYMQSSAPPPPPRRDTPEQKLSENDPLSAVAFDLNDGDGEENDWQDAASEVRDDDIFDSDAPMAPDHEPVQPVDHTPPIARLVEDSDASDYIARARAAAISASRDQDKPASARMRTQKSGRNRMPLYAAASIVIVAAGAGALHLRGKQTDPVGVITADAITPRSSGDVAQLASLLPAPATEAGRVSETAELQPTPDGFDDPDLFDPEPAQEPDVSEPGAPRPTVANSAENDESASDKPVTASVEAQPPRPTFVPIPPQPTLEQAATAGNRLAQFQLARERIDAGDFAVGASLMRQAAESGLAPAQYRLAKLHEKGLGVSRDLAEARKWTERAAQGGNIKAMHDIAVYLAEGEGGPQTYAGAVEWFSKASQHGVVDSQYNLGVLYEQGLGISPDPVEALFWFSVAARQGDPGAPDMVSDLRARVALSDAQNAERRAATWTARPAGAIANGQIPAQAWADQTPQRVRAVQLALNALGFDAGTPDGVIGPATRDAIRAFRSSAGLSGDGDIDEALVAALNAHRESAAG